MSELFLPTTYKKYLDLGINIFTIFLDCEITHSVLFLKLKKLKSFQKVFTIEFFHFFTKCLLGGKSPQVVNVDHSNQSITTKFNSQLHKKVSDAIYSLNGLRNEAS